MRVRDPRGDGEGAGRAGDLAEHGARFLSAPPARPRPSGPGMGGGVFRPFLSTKLFHARASALPGTSGEARTSGSWQAAELGETKEGVGKEQQGSRRSGSTHSAV